MSKRTFRCIKHICAASFLNLFLLSGVNAWTIEESFDGLADGAACPKFNTSSSVISSTTSVSGSKSCKQSVTGGVFGFGEWGGIIDFADGVDPTKNAVTGKLKTKLSVGDEIWIRVRTNFPVGFNYDASPKLKFLRVRTWTQDRANRGYDDWYINNKGSIPPFSFIYEGRNDLAWNDVGTAADAIELGAWETYEFYIKFDTKSVDKGGTGRMRAWKNGVLLKDMTDRATLRLASDYADAFYLFTWWNKKAPKTQSMHIDDLVVTTDQPLSRDSFDNPVVGMSGFTPAPPSTKALPNPPENVEAN